jgi:glutaconate CoA-transferase subunit B
MKILDYSLNEMMAIAAARLINNGDIVFCGTGISIAAAMAAKRLNAPNSIIFFETGAIDPFLYELPLMVADSRVMYGASINTGLVEALSIIQNDKVGPRIVAILGAAQIDKYGNINSTSIGNYHTPKVRFPGSGGATDATCLAGKTIIFMKHDKKRFVRKVDYLTGPGWISGPGSREKAGLRRGGPSHVITDIAILQFDEKTKEMYLDRVYPNITPEQVQEQTGFKIDISRASLIEPPISSELRALRQECDPQGLII